MRRRLLGTLAGAFLVLFSALAHAAPFAPGNLLVTHDNQLIEYTLDGVVVQSMEVPHPDTTRRDATDIAFDRFGRVHVLNIAPFAASYLSTYDPVLETWTHLRVDAFLGNISDGDLSILGDVAFTKNQSIDILTGELSDLPFSGRETSVGLDGLIYVLSGSFTNVDVRDPGDLSSLRTFMLTGAGGARIDPRGIAASLDGSMFLAGWDGRIYTYDATGNFLESIPTTAGSLLDIDLAPSGRLAMGSRFGNVVVTDLTFQSVDVFSAGGDLTYVAFVPVPGERPDADEDGVLDILDNCPDDPNPLQEDRDEDALGDACDPYPDDPENLLACQADLAAAEGEVAELAAENEVLVAENTRLAAELAECREPPDADGDGVPDGDDACPDTAPGAAVDPHGCSQAQFCAGFSGRSFGNAIRCFLADWRGNEWTRRDCRPNWNWGRVTCVPVVPRESSR